MIKKILLTLLLAAWPNAIALKAAPKPLGQAHAHNDYYHKRPLLDALSHGFCSVEADVFLKNGNLLVGHFSFELKESRTLESLYLAPLAKRVKANGGSVHKTKAPFHLMIDFKTDGPKTYAALQPLLEKYRFMITEFGAEKTETKAVTIVISGSRPRTVMENQTKRLAGYDGRLSDLGQAASPTPHPRAAHLRVRLRRVENGAPAVPQVGDVGERALHAACWSAPPKAAWSDCSGCCCSGCVLRCGCGC